MTPGEPVDDHDRALLGAVRPPDWINPAPAGRYGQNLPATSPSKALAITINVNRATREGARDAPVPQRRADLRPRTRDERVGPFESSLE